MAVVGPVYLDSDELIGFTAVKAHFLDIGASYYSAARPLTTSRRNRIAGEARRGAASCARSIRGRSPPTVRGSRRSRRRPQRRGGRALAGAAALRRVVKRHGSDTFAAAVDEMYDRGEAAVRASSMRSRTASTPVRARWTAMGWPKAGSCSASGRRFGQRRHRGLPRHTRCSRGAGNSPLPSTARPAEWRSRRSPARLILGGGPFPRGPLPADPCHDPRGSRCSILLPAPRSLRHVRRPGDRGDLPALLADASLPCPPAAAAT